MPTKTLVHGYIGSQCIHDLQDKFIELALAEGQCPLGIFKDKYADEMNLPTLFLGDPRDGDIVKRFCYQKIAQWEIMHHSGDSSYHTTNLFFKTLRIIIENVLACISIRIRKGKLKGRKLLEKDINTNQTSTIFLKVTLVTWISNT